MTLLEQIQTACTPDQIGSRNDVLITDLVNAWRTANGVTRKQPTAIGKGSIIAALGMDSGNAFLDVVYSQPAYRHIKDVITAGAFDVTLDVSAAGISAMVAQSVITQTEADALLALGQVDDPVAVDDVSLTLNGAQA